MALDARINRREIRKLVADNTDRVLDGSRSTKLQAAANHYEHDLSANIEAVPQGVTALDPSLVAVWALAAPLLVCTTMTPFDRALLTIPPRTLRWLSSFDAYGVTGEKRHK